MFIRDDTTLSYFLAIISSINATVVAHLMSLSSAGVSTARQSSTIKTVFVNTLDTIRLGGTECQSKVFSGECGPRRNVMYNIHQQQPEAVATAGAAPSKVEVCAALKKRILVTFFL